ncbi:Lysophospholipid acyltransferase LPEAT2, partial [Linum grandiflorum]
RIGLVKATDFGRTRCRHETASTLCLPLLSTLPTTAIQLLLCKSHSKFPSFNPLFLTFHSPFWVYPSMSAHDLSSPLLASSTPPPHITLSVDADGNSSSRRTTTNHDHAAGQATSNNHNNHIRHSSSANFRNPFGFLCSDSSLSVPQPSTVDPFRNATPRVDGLYEVLKILILLPVVILRLLLFGLCLALGYVATKLAILGWRDKHNPMPRWRSRLMWVTRFCTRGILFAFGYQWIRRRGKPAPRDIAPIVVSNHVSYVDPIFYFYEMCPTIVASESHDAIPFVGTIIRAMQVIYVNRFSQSSRKNAVNEIKKCAFKDLNTEKSFLR